MIQPGDELRIVLADDHSIVRAGLRALIEGEPGMQVIAEAENGADAVRLASELRPHVVVIDISMPGGGGIAATRRIRTEAPDTRVLILTMHDDRAHLTDTLDAGATGYVLKRSARDELVRAIRAVGAGEPYVDPRLAGAVLREAKSGGTLAEGAAPLSKREEEVLRRIAWGESNKLIARDLEISTRTVETYKARIAEKLGLNTRPEFVRYAVRQGWLAEE